LYVDLWRFNYSKTIVYGMLSLYCVCSTCIAPVKDNYSHASSDISTPRGLRSPVTLWTPLTPYGSTFLRTFSSKCVRVLFSLLYSSCVGSRLLRLHQYNVMWHHTRTRYATTMKPHTIPRTYGRYVALKEQFNYDRRGRAEEG